MGPFYGAQGAHPVPPLSLLGGRFFAFRFGFREWPFHTAKNGDRFPDLIAVGERVTAAIQAERIGDGGVVRDRRIADFAAE